MSQIDSLPEFMDREETRVAEEIFVERAKTRGWKILRHGWPDYLLFRSTGNKFEFIAVEVKRDFIHDKLNGGQRLMLAALVLQGIRCFVWSAEDYTLRKFKRKEAERIIREYHRMIDRSTL